MITHSGRALVDPYIVFDKVGLAKGMRVADLGCGRVGHFVFPAARIVGETGIIYAVDILEEVLKNIASNIRSYGLDNIEPVWANIEKYGQVPVPMNTIDVVFITNVMFQLKDKIAAIKEAGRLLTDGGKLVIIDWQKKLSTLGPLPDQMLTVDAVVAMAKQVGLVPEEKFALGNYHFCLAFKK